MKLSLHVPFITDSGASNYELMQTGCMNTFNVHV